MVLSNCSGSKNVGCMNANAVAYTNKIRKSAGLKPLGMGTSAMLKNALGHSREMADKGDIYHQPIGKGVYVGAGDCKGMLTGENVAMNFIRDDNTDAAALCVEQWRKSPGHYRNIVNQDNVNVVIAIYTDSKKNIWCTQTFSRIKNGQCSISGSPKKEKKDMEKEDDDEDDIDEASLVKVCPKGKCKFCEPKIGGRCWKA